MLGNRSTTELFPAPLRVDFFAFCFNEYALSDFGRFLPSIWKVILPLMSQMEIIM